jgi:hypothetical protein
MAFGEGLSASRIEENEIEGVSFDGLEHVIPLFLGVELVGKVVAVGANIV